MCRGHSSTGLTMPKTPGSRESSDETRGSGRRIAGDPFETTKDLQLAPPSSTGDARANDRCDAPPANATTS